MGLQWNDEPNIANLAFKMLSKQIFHFQRSLHLSCLEKGRGKDSNRKKKEKNSNPLNNWQVDSCLTTIIGFHLWLRKYGRQFALEVLLYKLMIQCCPFWYVFCLMMKDSGHSENHSVFIYSCSLQRLNNQCNYKIFPAQQCHLDRSVCVTTLQWTWLICEGLELQTSSIIITDKLSEVPM